MLLLKLGRFRTSAICRASRARSIECALLISTDTLIKWTHVPASAVLSPRHLIIGLFLSERGARKRFSSQHDLIGAENGSNKFVKVRLHGLPIFLQHFIVQFDGLLKFSDRLCVIFVVPLQGYHVLFEFLDQFSVLIFGSTVDLQLVRWLESLGHDCHVLLLDEELQSLNILGHLTFRIVPNADGIILKS